MILDIFIDERHQSSHTLTYVIPADDAKATLAVEDHEIHYNGNVYYIDQIEQERDGTSSTIRVTANALWMRLAGPKRVGSFVLTAVDAASGLDLILADTGWTRGDNVETASGGVTSLQTLEAQDTSVLDLVWRWAKLFNLEVTFDTTNKVVDFVSEVGARRGLAFRYGRNLTKIKRTARVPEATRVYAYGRDKLSITGINPTGAEYVEDLSFYTAQGLTQSEARANRKDEVLSDNDIVDELSLYQRALSRLAVASQPYVKYEASVVDLSELLGIDERAFGVGDTVRVHDSVFNWNFRTRIVRRVHYPLEPWRDTIELSNLDERSNTTGQSYRDSSTRDWNLFKKDSSELRLLNAGSFTLNRIGVAFVEGEAVFGYDINCVGVGTGTLSVSAVDASDDTLLHTPLSIPFTDGAKLHGNMTWALQGLSGQKDYRIRAIASGGGTVRIPAAGSRFWVLARGATQRTPRLPNSQRFNFVQPSGGMQQFTVPDNVTEVVVTVVGSSGQRGGANNPLLQGGPGGEIVATMPVTPGQVFDVVVGGRPGWPNGGRGGTSLSGNNGGWGGGSSDIRPAGGSISDAYIVAAGGGGAGFFFNGTLPGDTTVAGKGGLYVGGDGVHGLRPGLGATDSAGGEGDNGQPGTTYDGGFNIGGYAAIGINGFAGPGGGGGGGYYGGGAAGGSNNGSGGEAGNGGGGTGRLRPEFLYDIEFTDGANSDADGYVLFEWELPED
jgi:phage minor structural protein